MLHQGLHLRESVDCSDVQKGCGDFGVLLIQKNSLCDCLLGNTVESMHDPGRSPTSCMDLLLLLNGTQVLLHLGVRCGATLA